MNRWYVLLLVTGVLAISCKSTSTCQGTATPDCMCTMQYDPVCGCDGKTYGNECMAACAGVKKWKKGACP